MSAQDKARLLTQDGASGKGLCTVSLDALLPLLKETPATEAVEGAKYFIEKTAIAGRTQEQCVDMTFTFDVYVVCSKPIVIPLLPATLAIDEASGTGKGRMVVHGNQHAWLAEEPGSLQLTIRVLCPYSNTTKCAVALHDLPLSSQHVQFTVADKKDIQITVDPALRMMPQDDSHPTDSSIEAFVSPTRELTIRWTKKEAETEATEAVKQPLSITAEHQTVFSVGEGVLLGNTEFNYDIRNGSISVMDIQVDPRIRVLNVDGPDVRRWDVVQISPEQTRLGKKRAAAAAKVAMTTFDVDDDAEIATEDFELVDESSAFVHVLRVQLDHGVSERYSLAVTHEVELHSTSCNFEVPVFCHTHEAFSREKGFIAVEARTNVEVEQLGSPVGCVGLDVEELPSTLRNRASNSVLLAYKYLVTNYKLQLAVKKHDDVDVLIAAADSCHFQCTATEEGKVMYKLIMSLRNTQKQYVRIKIPATDEIWTTVVKGMPVKPARDKETGEVMIPLPKSSSRDESQSNFGLDIVWVTDTETTMDERGQLSFALPEVDLPLNKVYVSVFTPNDYKLGEFEGDLSEVTHFSGSPPKSQDKPAGEQVPALPMQNLLVRQASLCDDDFGPSLMKSSFNYSKKKQVARRGVAPVHVQMVISGRESRFERLLVVQQEMKMAVEYKREVKRTLRKLDERSCCIM